MSHDPENPPISKEEAKQFQRLNEAYPEVVQAFKRGRPRAENPKEKLTVRLDAEVVEWLRKHKGYNRLINEALRDIMQQSSR